MKTPFHLGQTFCNDKLIYTVAPPNGGAGLYFCDSDGTCEPLDRLARFYPDCELPDWLGSDQPELVSLGRGRWSAPSIQKYARGGVAADLKQAFLDADAYLREYYVAPSSSRPGDPTPEDHYRVASSFVLSTYVFTIAETVPYLHIVGEPSTGKTLFADLLEDLCFNARQVVSITSAAMYRLLDCTRSTLLIDEQQQHSQLHMNIMLAGYRRSGTVLICDRRKLHPVERSCFAPKVLLTNEELPNSALASRTIRLISEAPTRAPSRYLSRSAAPEAARIRDLLYTCALRFAPEIAREYRDLPTVDGISNRDEDLGALPLAVARVIDRQPGPELGLYDALVEFFRKASARRREAYGFDAERPAYARAIIEFTEDDSTTVVSSEYYLADQFRSFITKRGLCERSTRTKEVGQRLNRFKLISERKIVDVTAAQAGIDALRPPKRIQRQAYRFDIHVARELAGA